MTQLASIDLQPLMGSSAPRYATRGSETANRFLAKFSQRDVVAIVVFCAIGLIVTFGVLTQVPDALVTVGEITLIP